jgi:thiamine-phosphate pyrophosphorylase
MAESFLLYYITDRTAFPGDERIRRLRLLEKIAEAASSGVDYIQLREKDLPARELESLAREAVSIIRNLKSENRKLGTALLINSRTDVALTTAADGVHLPAYDVSPEDVRTVWARGASSESSEPAPGRESTRRDPLISVSCHSPREVSQATVNRATIAIFAPVFEKKDAPGTHAAGLNALGEACRAKIPVLALGGITLHNAESCIRAGAAGIAAIRLFQENNVSSIVRKLRS